MKNKKEEVNTPFDAEITDGAEVNPNDMETSESQPEKSKKEDKKFDFGDKTEVEFTSNGKSKHMPEGSVYVITTELAAIFLDKGYGKVKK